MFCLVSAKDVPENRNLLVLLLLYCRKGAAGTRHIAGGSSHSSLTAVLVDRGQW